MSTCALIPDTHASPTTRKNSINNKQELEKHTLSELTINNVFGFLRTEGLKIATAIEMEVLSNAKESQWKLPVKFHAVLWTVEKSSPHFRSEAALEYLRSTFNLPALFPPHIFQHRENQRVSPPIININPKWARLSRAKGTDFSKLYC